jgi:hypothetical protein
MHAYIKQAMLVGLLGCNVMWTAYGSIDMKYPHNLLDFHCSLIQILYIAVYGTVRLQDLRVVKMSLLAFWAEMPCESKRI